MLPLFCVLWFFFQAGAALLCFKLPNRFFEKDNGLYRIRRWERQGEIYDFIFKVKKWKKWLPDGGAIFGGYAKKRLRDNSTQNLEIFLLESRRAELTHWLAIAPFWVFGFFAPIRVIPIMLVYALVINVPCIIAQRYNRPRIEAILKKRSVRMAA